MAPPHCGTSIYASSQKVSCTCIHSSPCRVTVIVSRYSPGSNGANHSRSKTPSHCSPSGSSTPQKPPWQGTVCQPVSVFRSSLGTGCTPSLWPVVLAMVYSTCLSAAEQRSRTRDRRTGSSSAGCTAGVFCCSSGCPGLSCWLQAANVTHNKVQKTISFAFYFTVPHPF